MESGMTPHTWVCKCVCVRVCVLGVTARYAEGIKNQLSCNNHKLVYELSSSSSPSSSSRARNLALPHTHTHTQLQPPACVCVCVYCVGFILFCEFFICARCWILTAVRCIKRARESERESNSSRVRVRKREKKGEESMAEPARKRARHIGRRAK